MRQPLDRARLGSVLEELARSATGPATIYLVGGTTAVVYGWRATTNDIDLLIEPERDDLTRAIQSIKERFHVNVEFASPLDFLPPLPGWRDRSPFVMQVGQLTVRHFDPYAQALAKIERGFDQDERDVTAMIEAGIVDPSELRHLFEAIAPSLYRFPAVDAKSMETAVERVVARSLPRGV